MGNLIQRIIINSIGLLASILGIFVFYKEYFTNLTTETTIVIFILGFIALRFIIENIYLKVSSKRKSKYGEALSNINMAFKEIHYMKREHDKKINKVLEKIHNESLSNSSNENIEAINEALSTGHFTELETLLLLQKVCDYISKTFNIITGTECSVCIKLVNYDEELKNKTKLPFSVFTLIRDRESESKRVQGNEEPLHLIDENTDFEHIYDNYLSSKKDDNIFLSNVLPLLGKKYKNSSFQYYKKKWLAPIWLFPIRLFQWPLP